METQRYKTILVGVDGSEQGNLAYKRAIGVAKRNKGRVVVAHVIENKLYNVMGYATMNDSQINQEKEDAEAIFAECKKFAASVNFNQIETVMTYGSAKESLSKDLPKNYEIDLIMVGQSGLNAVERMVLGSVSNYIIRHAPCDVLIVHPEAEV